MGTAYKSPRATRPGRSVFIATSAYESVKTGYAWSLALTTAELTRRGIPFEIVMLHNACHVDDARNSLVKTFLHESDCTDLVFIDADLRWMPEMFLRLLKHDTDDIIAGAYPFKSFPRKFPVGKILKIREEPADERGWLEVSYAPTGFMRIPRTVFETLAPKQTKRGRLNPQYRFFERRYTENTYDGGDVTFCRKWIAEGGKVLIDPALTLEHIGEHRWSGCFLDYLNENQANKDLHTVNCKDPMPAFKPDHPQEKPAPAPAAPDQGSPVNAPPADDKGNPELFQAVNNLLLGRVADVEFQIIADAYGNKPWAATPEYLRQCYLKACETPKGGLILECGSGISTLLLAIGAERNRARVIAFEHDHEWLRTTEGWLKAFGLHSAVQMIHMPIDPQTHWYKGKLDRPPELIVIDGPPRYLGSDRLYPLRQEWIGQAFVLADDAFPEMVEQLRQIPGQWEVAQCGARPIAAGRVNVTPEMAEAAE